MSTRRPGRFGGEVSSSSRTHCCRTKRFNELLGPLGATCALAARARSEPPAAIEHAARAASEPPPIALQNAAEQKNGTEACLTNMKNINYVCKCNLLNFCDSNLMNSIKLNNM